MASSDILSHTLSSITSIKLEEISNQQATFKDGKSDLLQIIEAEPNQENKIRFILDHVDNLATMGNLDDNESISLANIQKFLGQAHHDPSVSEALQKDWQNKIEKQLDIHSLRYEYASLYGRLVKEWLSASDNEASSSNGADFERVGRSEMHEQRARWEGYVFKAFNTDPAAIKTYLKQLFSSNGSVNMAWLAVRSATKDFEKSMACNRLGRSSISGQAQIETVHFDETSLKWVIAGLLRSDLLSDEKRKILKSFQTNKAVLAEVADVLNMRLSSLEKWKADESKVEERRQLNGRYRFYHDEDLLQTILLRYIGIKWSVHFKKTLVNFHNTANVWRSSSTTVPWEARKRRDFYLGSAHDNGISVESQLDEHFKNDILLEQLQDSIGEVRGGYDHETGEEIDDNRKSPQEITQSVLHVLASDIILKTHLGQDVTVVRSDFSWFGPSLPHSTMFAVLDHFGVSSRWIEFFRRALEAPMKFSDDGADVEARLRVRGTPISGPLSDMLGETVLFCLDFAMNQATNGAKLHRLHDDIWFWGSDRTCVEGWAVMTEFAQLMGLEFNPDKTGSVKIMHKGALKEDLPRALPKGDVCWGFLKLDSETGRFIIDQANVDKHIEELSRQLAGCKSIFDWIQAWNIYGARFFTTNFGRPAHCFGLAHVDQMLETFSKIQKKLFASTGGSVTSTLKQMLTDRFGVENIPEGYLYFPMSMGGLDVKNPFVGLYLVRDNISVDPNLYMTSYFEKENISYEKAKKAFETENVGRKAVSFEDAQKYREEGFMAFEEYTKYREQSSGTLGIKFTDMLAEPYQDNVVQTCDVASLVSQRAWLDMDPYHQWIIQLYAPEMIPRFGGLNIVEKGLLPIGMVSMFRESRFKWQG